MDSLTLTNVLLILILAYLVFRFDRDTFNLIAAIALVFAVIAGFFLVVSIYK